MRRLAVLIVTMILYQSIYAQFTSIDFFAQNDIDQHSSKVMTFGENIYQYNNFFTSSGEYNSIIRKLSSDFEQVDTLVVTNENSSIIISDLINFQSEYLIAIGAKEISGNPGFFEIMILKLDETLSLLDENYFNLNTGALDHTYHYIRDYGEIVVATSVNGNPPSTNSTFLDFLIMEINQNCELVYDSIFDYSPSEFVLDFIPIDETDNSIILCTPNFEPGSFSKRLNVIDENYNLIESFYIPEREYFMSIKDLNDSKYLLNSRKFDQSYTPTAWLAQQRLIDESFNEIAINVFGSPDTMMYPAQYNSIAYKNETNIYTVYTYNIDVTSYSSKESFVCLSSIDDELNQNWTKYYGGDAYYFVCDICPANDNGCIITGTRYKNGSAGPFEREIFIMKVDENGLITSTNEKESIPIKNAIITPNPGKDYLQLHTGIFPAALQMFDINGKLILEEEINQNSTTIHTQSLSSGTYIWQLLKDGQVVETDKWVKK